MCLSVALPALLVDSPSSRTTPGGFLLGEGGLLASLYVNSWGEGNWTLGGGGGGGGGGEPTL